MLKAKTIGMIRNSVMSQEIEEGRGTPNQLVFNLYDIDSYRPFVSKVSRKLGEHSRRCSR